jgi:uncharacterized OsmC-like protein
MTEVRVDREAVSELMAKRRAASEERKLTGTERVDVKLEGVGNGPFRVSKKDWEWAVDEPAERGGTDSAPNPLAYFLSGAITCLLSHCMLTAIEDGVEIAGIDVTARMRYNRAADVSKVTEAIYTVRITSPAQPEALTDLLRRAQDMCYALNTLAAAGVALRTEVELNGEPLVTLEV